MTIEDWSAMDYNVRVLPSRWFKSGARQRAGLAVSQRRANQGRARCWRGVKSLGQTRGCVMLNRKMAPTQI